LRLLDVFVDGLRVQPNARRRVAPPKSSAKASAKRKR